jgi:diguanylate cyclase (GGDEF)-like protein
VELEEEIRSLREDVARLEGALAAEREARRRSEEEVRALADQDPLTGLASARRFGDRLAMAVIHAQRNHQKLAVVQVGLDRFTKVNERLGRSLGDDLLRSVALALESTLRQGDTVGRFAGDVFTLLLPGIKRDEDVTVVADRLRLALRSPFSIGGNDIAVTASLGIALFPDDGPDTESLLQSASVSMRRAKEKGGDTWDVHAPRSRAIAAERQAKETALRRALAQGELQLYWQPVVECETGAIVGVESLLRWRR